MYVVYVYMHASIYEFMAIYVNTWHVFMNTCIHTTRLSTASLGFFPCFRVVIVLDDAVASMHHVVHPYCGVVDVRVSLRLCRVVLVGCVCMLHWFMVSA